MLQHQRATTDNGPNIGRARRLLPGTDNTAWHLAHSATVRDSSSPSSIHPLIAPVGLLGSTAAVYAHILQNANSSLTPLAAVYMIMLAIQYAVQPKLSRTFIRPHTSKVQIALTEEVTKSALAALLFGLCNSPSKIQTLLSQWQWQRSLAVAGTPACLYAIQGVLQYQSHQHLDSVSYNGLQQTKTLSAAFFCWLLLGQRQTLPQLAGLFVLFVSALLFQKQNNDALHIRFWRGVVPCVVATLISGLAGALSQKGLTWSATVTDPFLYSLEVSAYSALVLAMQQGLYAMGTNTAANSDRSFPIKKRPESSWDSRVLIPVLCKACGGILTALVHKHTGAVSKGFALVFGLVLATVMESALTNSHMSVHQMVGTVLVITAGWFHFAL